MTRDEAVALVKQVLGFSTNLDSTIVTNMIWQQTMLELSPTKPWFLLSDPATLTVTSGDPLVSLPADFLMEHDDYGLAYLDETVTPNVAYELAKDSYDVLRVNYREEPSGPPQAYAALNTKFHLFPLPDDAYTLTWRYWAKDDELTSNIENLWLEYCPSLLIGKTGVVIAQSKRDWEAEKRFKEMVQEGYLLLDNQTTAREVSSREMQMGGPH